MKAREHLADLAARLQDSDAAREEQQKQIDELCAAWIERATELLGGTEAFYSWANHWDRERYSYRVPSLRFPGCFESRVGDPTRDGTEEERQRWREGLTIVALRYLADDVSPEEAIARSREETQ